MIKNFKQFLNESVSSERYTNKIAGLLADIMYNKLSPSDFEWFDTSDDGIGIYASLDCENDEESFSYVSKEDGLTYTILEINFTYHMNSAMDVDCYVKVTGNKDGHEINDSNIIELEEVEEYEKFLEWVNSNL